jgi:hypothetical protein
VRRQRVCGLDCAGRRCSGGSPAELQPRVG